MTTKTKTKTKRTDRVGGRELVELPIGQVKPNPRNIRDEIENEDKKLQDLSHSIKVQGIINPLVAFPELDDDGAVVPDSFLVADGHRRLAAAGEAGLEVVPTIVKASEDAAAEAVQIMLATGSNHQVLNRREEARGIQQLFDLGLSKTRISKEFKQKPAEVVAKAKIAQAPEGLQMTYYTGGFDVDGLVALQKLEEADPDLHGKVSATLADRRGNVDVDRVIEQERRAAHCELLKAELQDAGAKQAPQDARYDGKWREVTGDAAGDELPLSEHVARGHKYHLNVWAPIGENLAWFAPTKAAKPELSDEEKAERKRLAELGKELSLSAVSRDKALRARLQQPKPAVDESALAAVFLDHVWFHAGFVHGGGAAEELMVELSGLPKPVAAEDQPQGELWDQLQQWREKVKEKFSRFGLQKLVAIYMYLMTRGVDKSLSKPQAWDPDARGVSPWPTDDPKAYIASLGAVWGFEIDEHEQAAIDHWAAARDAEEGN